MTLEVTAIGDESCFEAPEWHQLLARDPNRHVFATAEWGRVWWEEFGSGKDLAILVMRRDAEVVALVPLYRKREDDHKMLRFLGGIDLTDYLGPICSRDDRADVAEALVGWLSTTDVAWDVFDAHNMLVPFGFAEFLVDRADRAGFDVETDLEETSAVLELAGDWEQYLGSLSAKDRHELRRKRRRLFRDHPDATLRSTTEESLDRDLKIFFELHRGAEGHKGHFMKPEIATFFERIARAFMPLGWLRLDLLEVAGRPLAATFGFQHERTFSLYNSAFEPDVARLSPGLVLTSELVKRAIGEGLRFFDFLRGSERYKFDLGAVALPLNNVRVMRHEPAR